MRWRRITTFDCRENNVVMEIVIRVTNAMCYAFFLNRWIIQCCLTCDGVYVVSIVS